MVLTCINIFTLLYLKYREIYKRKMKPLYGKLGFTYMWLYKIIRLQVKSYSILVNIKITIFKSFNYYRYTIYPNNLVLN